MISSILNNQPSIRRNAIPPLAKAWLLTGFFLTFNWASGYAEPILDKAYHFLKVGRVDSAISIYQAYLSSHPTSMQAELAMSEIAMRRFDYPTARAILERALAQHPDSPEISATLGRLFQLWSNAPNGKVADNTFGK